jgi:hypothetical protein
MSLDSSIIKINDHKARILPCICEISSSILGQENDSSDLEFCLFVLCFCFTEPLSRLMSRESLEIVHDCFLSSPYKFVERDHLLTGLSLKVK